MTDPARVAELFGDAAELDGAARVAFLDRACGDDAGLRREIDELLRHDPAPLDSTVPARAAVGKPRDVAAHQVAPVVGRFEIERVLGEGGMGVVYLARDPTLSRNVAVKLLKGASFATGRARLMREAEAMARITHPNVAAVFEVGREGTDVWIAMEYVEGGTLHAWLKSPRSSREILEMFVQAGRGLAAAHRAGLLHRDFKPQNVLVGVDGRARVVDFGLARRAGEAAAAMGPQAPRDPSSGRSSLDLELTSAGDVMGTPGYMSPEHFEGNIGPGSDQWSFAASLYRALYRQMPFSDGSFVEIREAVLKGIVQPPPTSDVSVEIEQAILRGLSRHPEDRHASLDELLDRVAEVLQRDPEQDRTRFARQRRMATGLVSMLALLSLLVAGLRTDFRYDLGLGGVLVQGLVGLGFLATAWRLFHKTAFGTSHNRKILLLFALSLAAMSGHRIYALAAGIAVVDVLRLDAITGFAFLLYGAIFLERWLLRGAALFVAYFTLTYLWPRAIVPGFGLSMLGVLAIATWSWPLPRNGMLASIRGRRSGSSTSPSSSS